MPARNSPTFGSAGMQQQRQRVASVRLSMRPSTRSKGRAVLAAHSVLSSRTPSPWGLSPGDGYISSPSRAQSLSTAAGRYLPFPLPLRRLPSSLALCTSASSSGLHPSVLPVCCFGSRALHAMLEVLHVQFLPSCLDSPLSAAEFHLRCRGSLISALACFLCCFGCRAVSVLPWQPSAPNRRRTQSGRPPQTVRSSGTSTCSLRDQTRSERQPPQGYGRLYDAQGKR